eukprot:COSAG02_NODE_344_length_24146_cov_12.795983_1_plen_106_part_00
MHYQVSNDISAVIFGKAATRRGQREFGSQLSNPKSCRRIPVSATCRVPKLDGPWAGLGVLKRTKKQLELPCWWREHGSRLDGYDYYGQGCESEMAKATMRFYGPT